MVRRDERVEAGTVEAAAFKTAGGERVATGTIVGAEAERVQLEAAVLRRCVQMSCISSPCPPPPRPNTFSLRRRLTC